MCEYNTTYYAFFPFSFFSFFLFFSLLKAHVNVTVHDKWRRMESDGGLKEFKRRRKEKERNEVK